MEDEENEQKREGKTTPKLSLREKMKNVGIWENGHAFLGVLFPQKSKMIFPKNGFSPNSKLLPILFPSHAITISTNSW